MAYLLSLLAEELGGRVVGDSSRMVSGVSDLKSAGPSDITFLSNPAYVSQCFTTQAGAVLVSEAHVSLLESGCAASKVVVHNPYLAMAVLSQKFHPPFSPAPGCHASSVVHPSAYVPASCHIGPGAVVEEGASLGERCIVEAQAFVGRGAVLGNRVHLHPGAKVLHGCHLHNNVILQAGAVVGSDGFGYAVSADGLRTKIPQVGIVVLEEDVEIGANTTLDRATFGVTRVGKGTKIDNLVQIAHNVALGEHCVIISQTGIAGSTVLGNKVVVGAQGGLVGHIRIADNVMLGARAGVPSSIEKPGVYSGSPAIPHKQWLKMSVVMPELPELRKQVRALEKKYLSTHTEE